MVNHVYAKYLKEYANLNFLQKDATSVDAKDVTLAIYENTKKTNKDLAIREVIHAAKTIKITIQSIDYHHLGAVAKEDGIVDSIIQNLTATIKVH